MTPPTTDRDGRLPTPVEQRPISGAGFSRLAAHWRRVSVWLSVWDCRGRSIAVDLECSGPWNMLWTKGEHFRRELAAHVRGAVESWTSRSAEAADADTAMSPSGVDAWSRGPWWPVLGFMAVPVRRRRRIVGVALGGVVVGNCGGEEIERLCTQCGLDRQVLAEMASRAGTFSEEMVTRIAPSVALSVEQARDIDVIREENAALSGNLENTYEELNLVYQISAQMQLPQKPIAMCQRVAREVVEVSRAAAVGFVLMGDDRSGTSKGSPGQQATTSLGDRVVCVGSGVPSLSDLGRLASCLEIGASSGARYLLLNQASEGSELRWAGGWLRHLVAMPLVHDRQLLGVLLAINCIDDGDFTSVDVQLLRAVADSVTAVLENQRLYDGVTDLLMGLLHSLVSSIDAKDPYTCGHSERVAYISRALAQEANLSPAECERVYLAGLLHDIGKLGVPDAILCKPGKLTKEEFDAMKKHPQIGVRILSGVRQIADLMPGVVHHHERMDGRGYPARLAGRSIPLLGRIICLADCFDAMTTNRTYRTALPVPLAAAEMRRCSGTQFDPRLVELFLRLDFERLLEEARQCIGVDPTIGHVGALNSVMGGSRGNRHRPAPESGAEDGAGG